MIAILGLIAPRSACGQCRPDDAATLVSLQRHPIGLAPRLWDRHDELLAGAAALIAACGCDGGCPACTGPRLEPNVDARALAMRLLAELGAGAGAAGAMAMPA